MAIKLVCLVGCLRTKSQSQLRRTDLTRYSSMRSGSSTSLFGRLIAEKKLKNTKAQTQNPKRQLHLWRKSSRKTRCSKQLECMSAPTKFWTKKTAAIMKNKFEKIGGSVCFSSVACGTSKNPKHIHQIWNKTPGVVCSYLPFCMHSQTKQADKQASRQAAKQASRRPARQPATCSYYIHLQHTYTDAYRCSYTLIQTHTYIQP